MCLQFSGAPLPPSVSHHPCHLLQEREREREREREILCERNVGS